VYVLETTLEDDDASRSRLARIAGALWALDFPLATARETPDRVTVRE
jgi:hypothetical protein